MFPSVPHRRPTANEIDNFSRQRHDSYVLQVVNAALQFAVILGMAWLLHLVMKMTRAHLDDEPLVRRVADGFSRPGQKWSWDFVMLMDVKDEEALAASRTTTGVSKAFSRGGGAGDAFAREHTLARVVAAVTGAGLEASVYKSRAYRRDDSPFRAVGLVARGLERDGRAPPK